MRLFDYGIMRLWVILAGLCSLEANSVARVAVTCEFASAKIRRKSNKGVTFALNLLIDNPIRFCNYRNTRFRTVLLHLIVFRQGEAEADVTDVGGGWGTGAAADMGTPGTEIPVATTIDALYTFCRAAWVLLHVFGVRSVAVCSPFCHIAAHVVESQLVGRFLSNRLGMGA